MIDFLNFISIVIFSTLTTLGLTALLLYLVHLPWPEWVLDGIDAAVEAFDRAFYWILDMVMGKHTCEKGRDDG